MKLNIGSIEIDRERVLKFLGYGSKKPPSIILKKLEEELEEAEDLLEIEALYRRLKIVETKDGAVLLEGEQRLKVAMRQRSFRARAQFIQCSTL